jgi:glycosyltransferase involved in cell wall biosynthesis
MPDIVHSHNALAAGFAGRRIQREFGIPYVITEHSTAVSSTQTWTKPFRRILEASYRDAGEVIAVSHALGGAVARIYQNAPIVVPNCVFGDFFTLPPRPRRLDNFQFYCAASLIERKGVHVLLRAFAKAFRGNAGITVTVAGDGPMRTELRELAQALEITDQVTWLGQISRERMREKMWSSHCFVLPSFHETFGVVLIEAMSTGLPVIATHCGGPEEIVDDRSGILLPPGDVDGLARALLEVTQRPWDQAAIRESALSRYDAPVVAGKLIGIYKSVIAGKTVKDRRLSPVEIAS